MSFKRRSQRKTPQTSLNLKMVCTSFCNGSSIYSPPCPAYRPPSVSNSAMAGAFSMFQKWDMEFQKWDMRFDRTGVVYNLKSGSCNVRTFAS